MEPPWYELGRDLHHVGISDPAVAKKLHEMGWRKFHKADVIHISEPTVSTQTISQSVNQAAVIQLSRDRYHG